MTIADTARAAAATLTTLANSASSTDAGAVRSVITALTSGADAFDAATAALASAQTRIASAQTELSRAVRAAESVGGLAVGGSLTFTAHGLDSASRDRFGAARAAASLVSPTVVAALDGSQALLGGAEHAARTARSGVALATETIAPLLVEATTMSAYLAVP